MSSLDVWNYGIRDRHTCAMQCSLVKLVSKQTPKIKTGDCNEMVSSRDRDHEDPFSTHGTTVAASFSKPSNRVDVLRWPIAPPRSECRLRWHGRSLWRFMMEVDINDTSHVCLFGDKWWKYENLFLLKDHWINWAYLAEETFLWKDSLSLAGHLAFQYGMGPGVVAHGPMLAVPFEQANPILDPAVDCRERPFSLNNMEHSVECEESFKLIAINKGNHGHDASGMLSLHLEFPALQSMLSCKLAARPWGQVESGHDFSN